MAIEYHETLSNTTIKGTNALAAIREYISCLMLLGDDISAISVGSIVDELESIEEVNEQLITRLEFEHKQLGIKE